MAIQWHPLFAYLLRPLVEGYYEVRTNLPVGDVPREADLVLLRRTTDKELPFRGLWRHLTPWNVLEYKGPTVSARLDDLDRLVELGLGVHRRLNEERAKESLRKSPPKDVSFWYLAGRLGSRFLQRATAKIGPLQPLGDGAWRGTILERSIFLVSGAELPVEYDSMPFHVLGVERGEKELAAAKLLVRDTDLWNLYTEFFSTLHPTILKELRAMARTSKKGPQFHLRPLVEWMGMTEAIDQMGVDNIIKHMVANEKQKKQVLAALFPNLSAAERAELMRKTDS